MNEGIIAFWDFSISSNTRVPADKQYTKDINNLLTKSGMVKQYIEAAGFKFTGTCNCDGIYTEKYSNGKFQLRIRTRKLQFKLKQKGISLTKWLPINELQKTIQDQTQTAPA